MDTTAYGPNFEGGRLAVLEYKHDPSGAAGLWAEDLPRLLASDDPTDRARAMAVARRIAWSVVLPPGTWTVYSTYRDGWGGPGKKAVWSAHHDEAAAWLWHTVWVKHWEKQGRDDFETHVGQLDNVPASYLRNPEADPTKCVM